MGFERTVTTVVAPDGRLEAVVPGLSPGDVVELTVRRNDGAVVLRRAGRQKGSVLHMSDDFDEPLEDFKDSM